MVEARDDGSIFGIVIGIGIGKARLEKLKGNQRWGDQCGEEHS